MSDRLRVRPPTAPRRPEVREVHGDRVVDEYAWLKRRDDPDTIPYLEAENAYCAARTEHLAPLREAIFGEIRARTQETDESAPARRGPWWYYTRTVEGLQYPIRCRRPRRGEEYDEAAPEHVLLDENALAEGHAYFQLGAFEVSPDHRRVLYSVDHRGDEAFTLRIRDLDGGADLPDEIPNTANGTAWALDGSAVYYVTRDETTRPYRVWRHRLGAPVADDELLHEERDERFHASVGMTRSRRYVVMALHSSVTSEAWILPADEVAARFRVVEPRRQGVEYSVDHQGERLLIVSNDGHEDFALFEAPVDRPGGAGRRPVWAPGPGTRVLGVDAFADHAVVHLRRDGLSGLRVIPNRGEPHELAFDEAVYTVRPGTNLEHDTATYRYGYTSLTTPRTVYDYDVARRTSTLRRRQPVLGGFNPADYETAREWAVAGDGARVPISLVWRKGTSRDGGAPCLLYGYGSYEASMDPSFSVPRLSLLDRGFVYAIAHVRGGGELGRRWYEDGKLLRKRTTFTDFVACADHLIASGWTSPARLVARGASAGGLLMGAVANMAPDRFRAIIAQVPFVDALDTILDPSLPLTVIEWEEWGNPVRDADVYAYMKSYSPYENVAAQDYPALLVLAGLNDPRVGYHEPAKWVARLRATATGDGDMLLRTEMGFGHFGPSGRYDAWREEAFVLAFAVDAVG
jgi:oligopeptidase B